MTRVHANAVPGDTTPIDGGNDVRFVLEINGGLAKRLGIVPGAEMRTRPFRRMGRFGRVTSDVTGDPFLRP